MSKKISDRLTSKEHWTSENPFEHFERHKGHAIEDLIKKYIPANPAGNCIEIGSFPGPFLAVMGDLKYTLNGIDFHPKNEVELPQWLSCQNFKIGSFVTADFFEYQFSKTYDVVSSFGFIEHFNDFENVILKHAALVNAGGYLVITVPNFRGSIQHLLHKVFDKENLALHNIESMRPELWARVLQDHGFQILYKGYFGGFLFWRGAEKLNGFKKKAYWLISRIIPRINKVLWFESPSFSAYCGIVAKRK